MSTLFIKKLRNCSALSEVASGTTVSWTSSVFITLNKVLGLCAFKLWMF